MESKKLAFSDQILPPRRKVVSGFGLGVVASVIVLTIVVLNNNSLKAPIVYSMIQGFNNGSVNSSIVSFSSTTSLSGAANTASVGNVSKSVVEQSNLREETHETDFGKNGNFTVSNEDEMIKEKTHFEDYSEMVKNGSFPGKEGRVFGQNLQMNSIQEDNNSKIVPNITSKDQPFEGNSSSVDNISDGAARATESNNVGNIGNSSEETNITADSHIEEMQKSGYKDCDIFDGRWVRDDSKPYYPAGSCPYIDRDFNCHLNGRPDDEFLKWKWQPHGCNIPSLNATDFLERLRGKKLVFVGDSLNRNMWESLVCILRRSIKDKRRVYEISGRREFKKKGLYAFRFEDYNCTVDFVGAPFLVRESTYKGKNGTLETLRLDLMDLTTSTYQDADVIIFNTGHWWTHEKTSRGEDYYQEGNYVHPRLKVLKAYKRALTTWARWVDKNIDGNKTQVFFRGFSVTHFRGGQWNSGGQCDKEVEPIFNNTYLAKYPSKMRALELVLQEISTPVTYLNISRLTDYRKDGHPSTYRMEYKANEEKTAAVHSQDCSHWCLPGVPDTWNELLYVSLLKAGRGSWRS